MGPGLGPRGEEGRMKGGRVETMDQEGLIGYWALKGCVGLGG